MHYCHTSGFIVRKFKVELVFFILVYFTFPLQLIFNAWLSRVEEEVEMALFSSTVAAGVLPRGTSLFYWQGPE